VEHDGRHETIQGNARPSFVRRTEPTNADKGDLMIVTRREAIRLCGALPVAAWAQAAQSDPTPPLAPGAPTSAARVALIDAFRGKIAGLDQKFEKRTHKSSWTMPYRLFRPAVAGKAPLVLYLHGSGGLGDDNQKQLGLGNIFGTFLWALPENQKRFPCYVLAPQTDRGWANYKASKAGGPAEVVPGFGSGTQLALDIVHSLAREFPIDDRRLYVMGQSMGGAGTWNMITHRPDVFAAAAICCGSGTPDDVTRSVRTPMWVFHGDADPTVPVSVSRDRIAALRKAGGQPLYTEYPGVNHNVWEWAFTEPQLVDWLFGQRRAGIQSGSH
jgi:predicted peptidase